MTLFHRRRTLVAKPWALLGLISLLALSCSAPTPLAPAERGGERAGSVAPPAAAVTPELRAALLAARQQEGGSEYAFFSISSTGNSTGNSTGEPGGRLRADNPQQRFRTELDAAGARLVHAGGTIGLRLAAWGCPGAMSEVSPRLPAVAAASVRTQPARRAEYGELRTGAGLVEWYENGPLGLEQGFTLGAPPACAGPGGAELRFAVAIQGAKSLRQAPGQAGEGTRVELALGDGLQRLIYSDLDAQDATGKPLPAQLQVDGEQVILSVDARAAQYPLRIDPLVWNDEAMLSAADGQAGDELGSSVAISGDTAVVGSPRASFGGTSWAGAAYVFVRSGTSWTQQAKLTASDPTTNSAFGTSVAISGDTVVVGSPQSPSGGLTVAGGAYVFVRSGTSWTQQAKLTASDKAAGDLLGLSVAIAGDTAVAGAPSALRGGLDNVGAAYVFVRSGTSWTQQAILMASDKAANDRFAEKSVAIASDTVVVGDMRATRGGLDSVGAAYVFVRSGTSWSQQAILMASDKAAFDYFGDSVAVDGDTAVVGADGASRGGLAENGAVYVFVRSGASWSQQAELMASDKTTSTSFGAAVALSLDTAIVGSALEKAYVLTRSGTMWTEQAKLTGGSSDHHFASAVAISGNRGVIGSSGTDIGMASGAGAAYVFFRGKTNGDSCMGDSECVSNVCAGGTCGKENGTACAALQECKSGFCTDGVCCQSACAGGTTDCQACSKAAGAAVDGTCGVVTAGRACRDPDASQCLGGGTCDGAATTCKLKPAASTVVCRSVGDPTTCIAGYRCDGATLGSCPTTNPAPADKLTVCSMKGDPSLCIANYRCDGVTAGSCPMTNPAPAAATTVCDAAGDASLCVARYSCDGMSAGSCPTTHPTPASSSTVCNSAGEPSKCIASYKCDGMSTGSCPLTHPVAASSTTICNAAGDGKSCAASYKCDGMSSGSCPTSNPTPAAAGMVCRPAAAECDAPGQCDGMRAACPPNPPKPDRTGCTGGSCLGGQCRPECDATLQLTAVPSSTSGQQPVTLRAQVANAGPSPADQLVLTLDLPTDPGLAVKQLQGDGWACQSAEASVRCTRSQLPIGAAPDVTMQVVPPIGQVSFTIKGTIGATTADANLLNNSAAVRVINLAPCTTGCMVDSGGEEPAAGCHCQLGGRAKAPPAGWALIALGLIAWRRQARRRSASPR